MTGIAIVGMACRYPDATTPRELWENALAGRRAFRRLPDVRTRAADYWDPDPSAPDRFYARTAAVLEGYRFDRGAHRVPGSTYRSTDLTHWLALDTARRALTDAGFTAAGDLPRTRTGVIVGNTLTGEFTRANVMRLRWPYVRRVMTRALLDEGWDGDRVAEFLAGAEIRYKEPFPEVDEDTLAGGLSNTIAGRICNHFDLGGGGYTVDGACSSSLLSAITAARALLEGDIDVAVAGGVDLSIDPFEIIGFAKAGALATGEMRMYDKRSNGFWPGEGCGMVVLMRVEDAVAAGHRIHAVIRGWGVSSDGFGGITRPEVDGYRLALRRAYDRAGVDIGTVSLFEGHGTGTAVGDAAELTALGAARAAAAPDAPAAVITSVKGTIGHTKAAAGVAGLIKTVMAVDQRMLPPTVGCVDPHELLTGPGAALRPLAVAEEWPDTGVRRAGVSAMGFGGINTHLVLENAPGTRRRPTGRRSVSLARSAQDAELLLFDADSPEALSRLLLETAEFAGTLSYAQLADLAAALLGRCGGNRYRAGVVVGSPQEAEGSLRELARALDAGTTSRLDPGGHGALGVVGGRARVGLLFPGQGATGTAEGALRRRFTEADETYRAVERHTRDGLAATTDPRSTAAAQPRIVAGSLAALRVLEALRVEGVCAVGHSLGELTALHWAGAYSEDDVLRAATVRGRAMEEKGEPGAMASLAVGHRAAENLIEGVDVVVAARNGAEQTVVSGSPEGVEETVARAGAQGVGTFRLAVDRAFHSPLVAAAAEHFGQWLASRPVRPTEARVVSTVTGRVLDPDADLTSLLRRQITAPVRFAEAVTTAAEEVDLFVEVGPGRVLSGLATAVTGLPAVPVDSESESLRGLLGVVAAAYVVGVPVEPARLFDDRLIRPLEIGQEFDFLANPCEAAPLDTPTRQPRRLPTTSADALPAPGATRSASTGPLPDQRSGDSPPTPEPAATAPPPTGTGALAVLRQVVAERVELPVDLVRNDSRLLDDLHLSSIAVGQLVNLAAARVGVAVSQTPSNFATATLAEVADVLDGLRDTAATRHPDPPIAGAAGWVRPFAVRLVPEPPPTPAPRGDDGDWELFATPGDTRAHTIRDRLRRGGVGSGVLACLPPGCATEEVALVLRAAQRALADPPDRFVLVQHGVGAAGLAKTLHQEAGNLRTTVVHLPPDGDDAADRVLAEVAATEGFSEVVVEGDGTRRVPTLSALPHTPERTEPVLTAADVLLVTGGGKGISAESALVLARATGASLALLGRSDPAHDAELAANLARIAAAGVTVRYARADVVRADEVAAAVAGFRDELGPVTALLHGAGRNEPTPLAALDADALARTVAPKVEGLRNLLAALEPERLRLLVTFGSVIGRAGLPGEAHYAVANEWLADLTEEAARTRPGLRARCLEWSVWAGVGMGERLAVVESLTREGITAITPAEGLDVLVRLVDDPDAPVVTVVSGRTGRIDTVRREAPPLPMLRFVGDPLLRYHGVELVTEVELNAGTDPYLADHLLDGDLLLPAVLGMEAMCQVASAATGDDRVPTLEQLRFDRPVVVPPEGSTRIRIAATVTGADTVEVAIRAEDTAFAVDHFRARLVHGAGPACDGPPLRSAAGAPPVSLEPGADLYGPVLFQGGRFRRLARFHRAAARHVDAELLPAAPGSWFAAYLPDRMLLADPGGRDALMHGNQVCVPDATLLPLAVDRVVPLAAGVPPRSALRFSAVERGSDGDTYVYDIAVRDSEGAVVERWEGLTLRAVRRTDATGPWAPALLGPYLERALARYTADPVAVTVEPHAGRPVGSVAERRLLTALAASRSLDRPADIHYRPDGRPELGDGLSVSSSHGADVTVTAVSPAPVTCDIERVAPRTATEVDRLLGECAPLARRVAAERGETPDTAATRVWGVLECLRKQGVAPGAPVTALPPDPAAGWQLFASGALRVATFTTRLRAVPEPVVIALLLNGASPDERRP
ncbi:type I polyketide synthase [Streptomyces spiramenti]|uniref:SDR family NAD(P)-dependent oxidoreductase n=1 Tax=Streptomyces spiramenti TaxID=2720606 RepID=A0ABX1AKP4_9ACTN|nr:type I polyketide synthase [Streptomyces spiramenti]NJP65953.1 SDR family NAD(P)-dependent oxidoreductase [Streptomyces spiramenti]